MIAEPSHTKVSHSAAVPMTASSISSRSQVRLLDLGVLAQSCGVVREGDRAGLEHVGPLGDLEREVRVLLDQEDRGALLVDLGDRLVDALDEDRGDAHRGLVEQQQGRLRHQGTPDGEHLLLAARHRAALLALALLQAWEQRVHPLDVLLNTGLVAAQVRPQHQVLEHRHAREDMPTLGRVRHAHRDDLLRRRLRDLAIVEADRTLARRCETRDRAQRGGFAGAVRADQRDALTVLHLDRDALEGLDVAVERVHILDLEQRHQLDSACLPRYASITRGFWRTSCGVPSAILVPWSSTVMYSEASITTCMSCSMSRMLRPRSSRSRRMKSVSSFDSWGFIPAVGSSSSSSLGSEERARAISSRRWSP